MQRLFYVLIILIYPYLLIGTQGLQAQAAQAEDPCCPSRSKQCQRSGRRWCSRNDSRSGSGGAALLECTHQQIARIILYHPLSVETFGTILTEKVRGYENMKTVGEALRNVFTLFIQILFLQSFTLNLDFRMSGAPGISSSLNAGGEQKHTSRQECPHLQMFLAPSTTMAIAFAGNRIAERHLKSVVSGCKARV